MAKSAAANPAEYLQELAPDRRAAIKATRELVLDHLPKGYEEHMAYGMICYCIPLRRFPDTYNKQPLGYIAIAAQKNYNALYLMGCYADSAQEKKLREAYRKAGRKIDMGKSCLRFKTYEELPAETLAELIAEVTPEKLIAIHEKVHARR